MNYQPRIIDKKVKEYLKTFGAVLIQGPKWCGKTWTATNYAKSVFGLADPKGNFRNRELAKLDPELVLDGEYPRLIDEWQEVPAIWDAVRYYVDKNSVKGGYILTGSATPDDAATVHSGAGRFGRIHMTTMTLKELGVSDGKVSLNKLLAGNTRVATDTGHLTIESLAEIITRGGWPGLIGADLRGAIESATSYVDAISTADLSRIDNVKRDPAKIMALLRSLARNSATYVSNETLRQDIVSFSDESITAQTVGEYLNLLKRVFILTELPAWEPPLKSTARLRRATKKMLSDPSLAVAALGANPKSLLDDMKLLGNLFESLVLHDLMVYADANDAKIFHYRDSADLEVDAIVEARNGTWGGIEVKLGYYKEDEAAENLLKLKAKMIEAGQASPAFLAVVTGVGSILKRRDDGVLVIPIDHLGE